MTDPRRSGGAALGALAQLTERLGACTDLDQLLTVALDSLGDLFGFDHALLLLLDETGSSLFTIASAGYDREGIGSEVVVGEGVIGSVAADGCVRRIGNLQRLLAYARSARGGAATTEDDIPLPGLDDANSQLAAPAMESGRVLGVLVVESPALAAFSTEDEHLLAVVAHVIAAAIELDRVRQGGVTPEPDPARDQQHLQPSPAEGQPTVIRSYVVDGSTFVDGEYLIKGVPGRILLRLLREHLETGRTEFTNREIRLDPSLELPSFRDNLESRLILLKRRLDERTAPVRIEKTGRGRFRLVVDRPVRLDCDGDLHGAG